MLRCPNAIEAPLLQGNRELWRVMEYSVKNIAPPNFMSSPFCDLTAKARSIWMVWLWHNDAGHRPPRLPWFCQLSRLNVQPIRAADFAVALSMLRRRVTINEADPDTFAVVGCSGPVALRHPEAEIVIPPRATAVPSASGACAAARCGSVAWVAELYACADAHACACAAQAAAGHPTTGGGVSRGLRSPWHRARFDRGCDRADDGGRVAHAHVPADLVRRTRQRRARRLPRWEPGSGVPSRRCVAVHDRSADARSGPMWWGW